MLPPSPPALAQPPPKAARAQSSPPAWASLLGRWGWSLAAGGLAFGLLRSAPLGLAASLRGAPAGLAVGATMGVLLGALDRATPWPGGLLGPARAWLRAGPSDRPGARPAGLLAALMLGLAVHFILAGWAYRTFHHSLLTAALLGAAGVALLPLQGALLLVWERAHARHPRWGYGALAVTGLAVASLLSGAPAAALLRWLGAPVGAVAASACAARVFGRWACGARHGRRAVAALLALAACAAAVWAAQA